MPSASERGGCYAVARSLHQLRHAQGVDRALWVAFRADLVGKARPGGEMMMTTVNEQLGAARAPWMFEAESCRTAEAGAAPSVNNNDFENCPRIVVSR